MAIFDHRNEDNAQGKKMTDTCMRSNEERHWTAMQNDHQIDEYQMQSLNKTTSG